jgi:uncharacterized protein (DUF1697 family)
VTSYVALLRSVNLVGNSVLKMADLRAIAEELRLDRPRTFIASGNLLFSSDRQEEELRLILERRLAAHMGREVRVIVRTAAEMDAAARANPFAEAPGNTVLAFFMNEAPPENLFESVRNCDDERIAAGTREVYVAYGEKGIGRSRLRIPAAEAGTARNMNTVAKLAQLAREME